MDMPRSFTERVKKEEDFALEVLTGHDAQGEPCYSIVLMPANRVEDLRRTLQLKSVVLDDYGEVLAKGRGHEPPEGLVEELLGLITRK